MNKTQDTHAQKLKSLEAQVTIYFIQLSICCNQLDFLLNCCQIQILELKKKQESQVELLKQKQKSDEAAKRLQAEIQYIKAQKVGFILALLQSLDQIHK